MSYTRLRFTLLAAGLVLALLPGAAAAAHVVLWEGHAWDHPYGNIAVNSDGDLEVTTSSCSSSGCLGAAHYGTSPVFRADPSVSVIATFIDEGPGTPTPQIWVEDESAPDRAWIQFGARGGEYQIILWDVDEDPGAANVQFISTGVARTAGEHQLEVGRRSDGTLDFYLDGELVYSTTSLETTYLGDIYLAGQAVAGESDAVVVWTSYRENQAYEGPIGPPTDKDQCKKGGWEQFNNPRFRNQGDCVSSVQSNRGGRQP